MRPLTTVTACAALLSAAHAHSRMNCPAARDPSTALKSGPCGTSGDDGSEYFAATDAIAEVTPGPLTIVWEESISHSGAPWRFSLSGDGSDVNDVCVLLDHVPHSPTSSPSFSDETTWVLYNLTIQIPDVACEKCSIHLSNPMTDKIGDDKYADGVGCCDYGNDGTDDCSATSNPPICSSVYHSCTVPFKITGSIPRADYVCPSQPADWPTSWDGTSSDGSTPLVDVTTSHVYRQESSTWVDGQLQTVDAAYRTAAGGLCAGATPQLAGDAANQPTGPNGQEDNTVAIAVGITVTIVVLGAAAGLAYYFVVVKKKETPDNKHKKPNSNKAVGAATTEVEVTHKTERV